MSWGFSVGGYGEQAASEVKRALDTYHYVDEEHRAIFEAFEQLTRALAKAAPGLFVTFESSGHVDRFSGYGTFTMRTYTVPTAEMDAGAGAAVAESAQ